MQELMFSVAVITYNQEMYISQTLDSILNQQHNYKYEIVIGEDCSTDNTKKIIEEYVEKYPEIIKPLYNNPNKGLINNYFNVINHCQGKYIMECAGDDYWLPGKVKSQIEFMESNLDVGMCYSKARVWNENKQKFEKNISGSAIKSFEFLLTNGNSIPALTVCLRSNIVKNYICEIKPQEKNWLMEDYPMWLYFSHESKIKFFDKETAVYRVLEDSASHSTDINKMIKFEESVYDIRQFYNQKFGLNLELKVNYPFITSQLLNKLSEKYEKKLAKDVRLICKMQSFSLKNSIYYICSYSFVLLNILFILKKEIKKWKKN